MSDQDALQILAPPYVISNGEMSTRAFDFYWLMNLFHECTWQSEIARNPDGNQKIVQKQGILRVAIIW